MQYLLSLQSDESAPEADREAMALASMDRVSRVNREIEASGAWVFAGGLRSSDSATVVRVQNGATTMTDGPFAETKEQVAGFWVIRVPDLDAALAWAEKCAEACGGPVEVRPFDDFSQG
ncbi:YciI family protein [Pseudonocardia sp. TRM90224]|uniref:YciI family protein n=1 Tax=Pseudonocardia sp. TRM90224 TaxID=2812678 RepID=UPI001E3FCB83|nr:YciI family protein [Pseudonocardia sp. TRM90224]